MKKRYCKTFGRRPRVRPSVMNPVDHPMGGRTKVVVLLKAKWKIKHGPSTQNKKHHNLIIILQEKVKKDAVKENNYYF